MQNSSRQARVCLVLIVPLILGLALFITPVASADSPTVHVVGWGDTLFSIANRYGTSVNAMMQANNLHNPSFIWVGERLIIPGGSAPSPLPSAAYVVQSGDTLFSIATRNGVTVDALMRANGLSNYLIFVGQTLRIPGQFAPQPQPGPQPLPQPKGAYYIVHPGDYLSMVATRYSSSVYAIQIANQLPNSSFIWVGQRLFIPGGIEPAYPSVIKPLPPIYPPVIPGVNPQNGQPPSFYPPTATPLPPVVVLSPSQPASTGSGIWEAVLITNTVGTGPCSLGAFVDGKTNWPVVVATTDGTFISDPKNTGDKPERGPYYVEFANSCSGIWRVIPLGLNIYADVQLSGGHAEVEFRQRP